MTISERFPNATVRPWGFGVWDASRAYDDLMVALHCVNTYDARESLLREAIGVLDRVCFGDARGAFTLMQKIESALRGDPTTFDQFADAKVDAAEAARRL